MHSNIGIYNIIISSKTSFSHNFFNKEVTLGPKANLSFVKM